LPLAAIVTPLSVMVVDVADSEPPQTDVPAMGVTITPGGVSVKPTPVRAVVAFGLVMVKFNVEVAPAPTVDGEKDFVTVGPSATVYVSARLAMSPLVRVKLSLIPIDCSVRPPTDVFVITPLLSLAVAVPLEPPFSSLAS
jgi:hypothetical protein